MKNPNKTKNKTCPPTAVKSRDIWVHFVMQIELRMQIRLGPSGTREGPK